MSILIDNACLTKLRDSKKFGHNNFKFNPRNVKNFLCNTEGTESYLERMRALAVHLSEKSPQEISTLIDRSLTEMTGMLDPNHSASLLFNGTIGVDEFCEEVKMPVRFFLKLLANDRLDAEFLKEKNVYDCLIFKNVANQPFFAQPHMS